MKKNYFFTLLLVFCFSFIAIGQEMLKNGGLEDWDNDTTPTDWEKAESLTKTSAEAHSGSFSAVREGGSGTKDLSQTISGITPGASYTLSFWYKVTAGDGDDARVWSNWKVGSDNVYHTGDVNDRSTDPLRGPADGYMDNNGGIWTKYEVVLIAPADVDAFYFEVRSYSNSTTYWDDLSFMKNAAASVNDNKIEGFATYPNPVTNNSFTITSNSTDKKEVKIFNVLGKNVFTASFSDTKSTFDIPAISDGLYILKVTEGTKTATSKLVIK